MYLNWGVVKKATFYSIFGNMLGSDGHGCEICENK